MKPSKLYEALHALIGERVPLHIWGACGVGKSQIVHQVADDLGCEFLDVRAVQLDPVDLRGLPRISADQTEWVPPKFLPTSGKGILFLDELTAAPQMTQAGCYQLVLDRRLGEYRLPNDWVVIAAGNPASERGVHFAMPRPLRNRFVHLDLEPDLDDWCKWAVRARVRPEIVAFLRFKPELLHDGDVTSDANAWPTPRSWEMASRVLSGIAQRTNARLLSGTSEFEAQLLDGTVAAREIILLHNLQSYRVRSGLLRKVKTLIPGYNHRSTLGMCSCNRSEKKESDHKNLRTHHTPLFLSKGIPQMLIGFHDHLAVLPFYSVYASTVMDDPTVPPLGRLFDGPMNHEPSKMIGEPQAEARLWAHL